MRTPVAAGLRVRYVVAGLQACLVVLALGTAVTGQQRAAAASDLADAAMRGDVGAVRALLA